VKCSAKWSLVWSGVEWSDVESEVEWSVVGWSVVMCSEGLSNGVYNIIRRCTDHMKFAACMAVSFITFFHIILILFFLSLCIHMVVCFVCFCLILYYVFLSLCLSILIVVYVLFCVFRFIVLFCVLFVYKCVLYYCKPGVNPTAVNKYIILFASNITVQKIYMLVHFLLCS